MSYINWTPFRRGRHGTPSAPTWFRPCSWSPVKETKILIEQMEKARNWFSSAPKSSVGTYCFKAYSYANKLSELNDALKSSVGLIWAYWMQGLGWRLWPRRILFWNTWLIRIWTWRRNMGCNHCHVRFLGSGIFIVGFDLHLKEFKALLLKKELLLLLLDLGCSLVTERPLWSECLFRIRKLKVLHHNHAKSF